jgi:tetratricopeptide (TPR) repeat protein
MLCAKSAARAADGLMAASDAIATCNEAIVSGVVDRDDMAATFVNRGVLLMTMQRPAEAKQDFDRALEVNPDTAEALVNRGAILLAQGKAGEAVADLDRGIALGPERPERAYYQRAMARETLKDIKGAYADYKMADSLRPGWEPVVAELARFKVVSR